MDQSPTRARTFFPWTKKVYPWWWWGGGWGVPPIVSFRPRHPHVIPLHQSTPWSDSLKHVALPVFHSFRTVQPSSSATMLQTLEKLVLTTVPLVVLLDLWKAVWHLPLEDLSKHPVQTQPYHWVDKLVPDAPLGWPCGLRVGFWGASS